jgi:hypothetical protein
MLARSTSIALALGGLLVTPAALAQAQAILGALSLPTVQQNPASQLPLFGVTFQPTTGNGQVFEQDLKDDGVTWQWLAEIPARKGDSASNQYHELHAVEANDGTIIAHIRNHSDANKYWTLQSESKDGGKTWSEPHPICYGLPSHLLKLHDGRLLMTYGHRKPPFGNQARVSTDNGQTWSEAMTISGDGKGGDLGYPSTVELADGSLLTVWYESMAEPKLAVLRQAHWTLAM